MRLFPLALLALPALHAQAPVRYDAGTISGLPARNIGSAQMSGRVAAVTAVEEAGRLTSSPPPPAAESGNPLMAAPALNPSSITLPPIHWAIAIDPGNPKNVWVGTGEAWTRNSVSIGDGVYKSTDGGENWTNVGLKDSERIAKILVDPKDGNTVYVCATGHLWDDSTERGVYKSGDGGKSWRKVLAGANPSTGCGMLAMSPQEPKTLYASLWDFRRQAWTFRSGGPGSGLFNPPTAASIGRVPPANAKGLPAKPYGPHRPRRRARKT